jgi:hypothetical protein
VSPNALLPEDLEPNPEDINLTFYRLLHKVSKDTEQSTVIDALRMRVKTFPRSRQGRLANRDHATVTDMRAVAAQFLPSHSTDTEELPNTVVIHEPPSHVSISVNLSNSCSDSAQDNMDSVNPVNSSSQSAGPTSRSRLSLTAQILPLLEAPTVGFNQSRMSRGRT